MDLEPLSLLAKLEPVLGIVFALNLAYIGLQRFRYRENIKKHVQTRLNELKDIPDQHCDTDWYKQILRLANLEQNDGDSLEIKSQEKMPSEIWAKCYVWIYENHRDRAAVVMAACACAALLFLGVAHEIPYLNWSRSPFTINYIHYWLWFVAFLGFLPIGFVLLGRRVVRDANDFVTRNIRNLKKTFQKQAQEIKIDVAVAGVPPQLLAEVQTG